MESAYVWDVKLFGFFIFALFYELFIILLRKFFGLCKSLRKSHLSADAHNSVPTPSLAFDVISIRTRDVPAIAM